LIFFVHWDAVGNDTDRLHAYLAQCPDRAWAPWLWTTPRRATNISALTIFESAINFAYETPLFVVER
jgi:hypothetical protein